MGAVVLRQLDGCPVHGDAAVANPVGVAPYGCAEITQVVFAQIVLLLVKAQHHVLHSAVAVGHQQRHNAAAVVCHPCRHAVPVCKCECLHILVAINGLYYLFVRLPNLFGHHFQLPAVVGQQSVHLALHIGGLCIYRRTVSPLHQFLQLLGVLHIFIRHLSAALEFHVAPVLVLLPQVSGQGQSDAPVFSQHVHTGKVGQGLGGLWVVVQVKQVPAGAVVAPAGGIHKPCGVNLFGEGRHLLGFKLAPAFVKGHPHHHAGVLAALLHNLPPFVVEVGGRSGRTLFVGASVVLVGLPLVAVVAAGHVLPHQQTQTVAQVVPSVWLHLHVFPDHVKAQLLCHQEVVAHGLFCRGGVETVGIPPLVQRAVMEIVPPVQLHAQASVVGVFADADGTHGGIRFHLVHHLAPFPHH